jgi:hypothetical protein
MILCWNVTWKKCNQKQSLERDVSVFGVNIFLWEENICVYYDDDDNDDDDDDDDEVHSVMKQNECRGNLSKENLFEMEVFSQMGGKHFCEHDNITRKTTTPKKAMLPVARRATG